jgi:glycosyltransferase involved in cell wall biosynthesis
VEEAASLLPGVPAKLEIALGEEMIDIFHALVLAREAHVRGVTHLHAHFGTSPTTVARLAAHFAGLTYSFTAHAKDIFHETVRRDDLARKLRDAAAVVTVSDYNVKFLSERYETSAAHLQRIYNGLDLEQFRFQLPVARAPHVVAVGRLVEKKGFADLVDACAILKARRSEFSCAIIGTGPLEIELREQIDRLGLVGTIELLGPRPQYEIVQLVQSAAVLAAPCVVGEDGNRDGLPTVLLEAMALGTPCVSTDVTGIPEVVRDGETGLLIPQHDPGALANELERLLTEPELGVNLAVHARELIESEFDVNENAAIQREMFFLREWRSLLQEVA